MMTETPLPAGVEPDIQASPKRDGADLNSAGSPLASSQPKRAPPRTLQEAIDAASNGSTRDPEQRLLALWGIQEPTANGQLCRRAKDNGRACLLSAGSWNKLRGLDLPALLSLKTANGETLKVLLVGLAGQDATLYVGDEEEHFPLHEVDRYWTGDFLVLWGTTRRRRHRHT